MKKTRTAPGRMSARAKTVREYLAAIPPDARTALSKLRRAIRAAAPEASEAISYGMPAFKYKGNLVFYAAFKDHCSFFPASLPVMRRFAPELKGYETRKGTIRFPATKPLPAVLVTKIVKARIAENDARHAAREKRKRGSRVSPR